MKKKLLILLIAALALIAIATIFFKANPKQQIAREAYTYGYPLVTMDLTRRAPAAP